MKILGLDPGLARTGFALIDTEQTKRLVRCGCLTTPSSNSTADRLATIGSDVTKIIVEHGPDQAVVETVFFGANSKTAMLTAETRGVLLYVLRSHHVNVHNLTPLQIKSRLTGYGAADKHQVQQVVSKRLNLITAPEPDDVADAIAAALCLADEVETTTNIPSAA
jgi:crossover junction endodeoxyribonuclease RuvC